MKYKSDLYHVVSSVYSSEEDIDDININDDNNVQLQDTTIMVGSKNASTIYEDTKQSIFRATKISVYIIKL